MESLCTSIHRRAALSQDDWKELLCCGGCEHNLKVRYEDFIKKILFTGKGRPVSSETPNRLHLSGSNDRLALAFLSIFWRAIVSSLEEFRFIFAPDYIEHSLREWVHSGQIPTNWNTLVSIRITELHDPHGVIAPFLTTPFFRQSAEGSPFEFIFIFGGYCLSVGIPPSSEQFPRTVALRPRSQTIRIEKASFASVPELKNLVTKMLAHPKGP